MRSILNFDDLFSIFALTYLNFYASSFTVPNQFLLCVIRTNFSSLDLRVYLPWVFRLEIVIVRLKAFVGHNFNQKALY